MSIDIPRNILCPVDLSDASVPALRYAEALSKCGGARITALYANAILMPPYFTESQLELLTEQFRNSTAAAEGGLARFVARALGPGSQHVEIKVVEAMPVDGILRTARETAADLIAMGTHGRSGVNRWMLGSVAERVLRESRIPVLTVRGDLWAQAPVSIQNILCPVNDSAVARRSLQLATKLAECLDATVTALHVKEQDSKGQIPDLRDWIGTHGRPQREIRELNREGEPSKEIIAVALETRCDLLILGAHHRLFFDSTVIGTTTVRTVRHAPCPVLTVVEWPD